MQLKYLLFLIMLIIGGFATSLLLIPSQSELALMKMNDKYFDDALKLYEKRLDDGNLDVDTVIPLSNLYLQYGEVEKAIAVMELYLELNPNNIEALQLLGKYYQYVQRHDDYLNIQKMIADASQSTDAMKILAVGYNFSGRYRQQIDVLLQLLKHEPDELQHYLDLVNLYASNGEFSASREMMHKAFDRFGRKSFDLEQHELYLYLLLRDKKVNQARRIALKWIEGEREPQTINRYISQFIDAGYYKVAKLLLKPVDRGVTRRPKLLESVIPILIAAEEQEIAFLLMEMVRVEGKLSPGLYGDYIDLAIALKQSTKLKVALTSFNLNLLAEATTVELVNHLLEETNRGFGLSNLQLSESFYNRYPILAARLTLANGERKLAYRWIAKAEGRDQDQYSRNQLVAFYLQAKDYKKALGHMQVNAKKHTLNENELILLAEIYRLIKRYRQGYQHLSELTDHRFTIEVGFQWVLLAIMAERTTVAETWLESGARLVQMQRQMLEDIYYVAADHKAWSISLMAARELNHRYGHSKYRLLLARVLFESGNYRAAKPLYRELSKNNHKLVGEYQQLLERAEADGDSQAASERVALLKRQIQRSQSNAQRLQLSLQILAVGEREFAEETLRSLALHGSHRQEAIQQLLYLWGARPNDNAIEWMFARIEETRGDSKEQLEWFERLLARSRTVDLPAMAIRLQGVDSKGVMLTKLMTELAGRKPLMLSPTLQQLLVKMNSREQILPLANKLYSLGYMQEVKPLYLRLDGLELQQEQDLKRLAESSYHSADYQLARESYQRYLYQRKSDWNAWFMLGETESALNIPSRAEMAYFQSYEEARKSPLKGLRERKNFATLLNRLNYDNQAIRHFQRLYQEQPEDQEVRQQLALLLIEQGSHQQATNILRAP